MAEKRTMTIEVNLDLTPAQNQMRGFVAANNNLTIPVQSPVGAAVGGAGATGAAAVGLGATTVEQAGVAAAFGKAEAAAAQYGYGASSPNWSYLMAQAQQGQGMAVPTAPRSATAGFFASPRVRAVLGSSIFGLHEIGRTGSALRNADAMAGFASSPEEAQLLRAEAVEQGSQGFFGSLVFGLPNAFGIEGSPAQIAQQARMSVEMRKSQDEIRSQLFDIADSRSVRSAYASGGQSGAAAVRSANVYARQIGEATANIENLTSRLNDRLPTERTLSGLGSDEAQWITTGGELKLVGTARDDAQLQLSKERLRLANLQEDAKQDAKIRADAIARQLGIANLIAGGASERDVLRYTVSSQRFEKGAVQTDAEMRAQEREFANQDWLNLNALTGGTQVFNLQAAGFTRQAAIQNVRNQGFMQLVGAMNAGTNTIPWMNALVANTNAQIGAINASADRNIAQATIGVDASIYSLTWQRFNEPLKARRAIIQGRAEQELAGITENDQGSRELRRKILEREQKELEQADRDFGRSVADVDLHLAGATSRTLMSINGGPSRFVRQQISGIIEQTEQDTRNLFRSGMPDQALERRELGQLQLRQAETEFYRSIQYREASPRGVYGTGNLGGVHDAFAKAATTVSGAGSSESGGWTPELVRQAVTALQTMATQGIAALAG